MSRRPSPNPAPADEPVRKARRSHAATRPHRAPAIVRARAEATPATSVVARVHFSLRRARRGSVPLRVLVEFVPRAAAWKTSTRRCGGIGSPNRLKRIHFEPHSVQPCASRASPTCTPGRQCRARTWRRTARRERAAHLCLCAAGRRRARCGEGRAAICAGQAACRCDARAETAGDKVLVAVVDTADRRGAP